jgi:hypothetical protein
MPADQLKPDIGFDSMKDALQKWKSNQNLETESRNPVKRESSSVFSLRNLVLLGIGGFVAYQNRFRIQRLLEARGIRTPWLDSSIGEVVKSGSAKLAGNIDRELDRAV